MKPAIPRSIEEVDINWLQKALGVRWPSLNITSMNIERIVHGAATKVLVRLTYDPHPAGLPSLVWIKAGWEEHSDWLASSLKLYAREAWFYGVLNQQLQMNAPRMLYADFSDTGQGIVLLDDLIERGARLTLCTDSADIEQMHRSLEELARLHAKFWEQDLLDDPRLDIPMRVNHPSSDWCRSNSPEVIAKYFATPRCDGMPASIRDPQRIDKALWLQVERLQSDRPFCLLHGDSHPGNGFVDADGRPGFFDWQTIAKGPWAYDVSYHLVSSLSVELRRNHERELLVRYLEKLVELGVKSTPSFNDAWDQYRRYIAYGLHIWITTPANFQSEANCTALTTRFSVAAEDLDFFNAWGV